MLRRGGVMGKTRSDTMIPRRPPPPSTSDLAALLGMAAVGLGILAALLWADARWSSLTLGGGSFFSIWLGVKELLLGVGQPYSASVAAAAQNLAYGGPPPVGANPYWLDIPLFLLAPIFPLAIVTDHASAHGVWMLLGQLSIAGAMLLSIRALDWQIPRPLILVLGLFAALSAYSTLSLQEGGPAAILTLGYAAILWSLKSGQDELAGACIAACFLKWEVGLPFLLLVTWHVLHQRRWRVVAGVAMTLTILLVISFLVRPGWLLPFYTAVIAMIRSPHGTSLPSAMEHLLQARGTQIALAISVLAAALLVIEWAIGRKAEFPKFMWLAYLALAVTPLLGFRSEVYDLTPLIPGYAVIAAGMLQRRGMGAWLGALLLGIAFVVPWFMLLRWGAVTGGQGQALLFIFLPTFTTAGLYWTRWWLLRPARTWMDEIRAARS